MVKDSVAVPQLYPFSNYVHPSKSHTQIKSSTCEKWLITLRKFYQIFDKVHWPKKEIKKGSINKLDFIEVVSLESNSACPKNQMRKN